MGGSKHTDPVAHFAASTVAAAVNFPLFKAAAIGQSGFQLAGAGSAQLSVVERYIEALRPPYRGMVATIGGMAWARGAIFYGSERGKVYMEELGAKEPFKGALPALVVSTGVQVVNMPIIRATITLQNPRSTHNTLYEALSAIYQRSGIRGWYVGTTAGLMKTVPKYCTAVVVKDEMEQWLGPPDPQAARTDMVARSALKAVAAGVAGAVLTNPMDVLRNEIFKTEKGVIETVRNLSNDEGTAWLHRGMGKNLIAVSVPIAMTIFLADVFERARA